MQLDFTDRHVVVTGGDGSLGQKVVAVLIEAGATCHVPVESPEALGRFEMARHGRVHAEVGVDLAGESAAVEFFSGLPGLWASIHCAGGFAMTPFAETSFDDFRAMMRVNAVTCFLSCREALKRIRADGSAEGGRIVNVAARPALEPRTGSGMAAYTASKSAVAALTAALAEETAKERIWVNAVVPSILDTPPNREAMPDADHDAWAKPEEVAATIAFLASPQNTSTRGALVPVYGAT